MAIKIYDKFAPRANVGDTNYPNGSIKNESVPGAKDGTPLDATWGNDYAGFDAALFAEAGVTPSGSADTALVSQRLQALGKLFDRSFATVALMAAYATPTVGSRYSTGGTTWDVVPTAGLPIGSGLFARPIDDIHVRDFGAVPNDAATTTVSAALQAAFDVLPAYGSIQNSGSFQKQVRIVFSGAPSDEWFLSAKVSAAYKNNWKFSGATTISAGTSLDTDDYMMEFLACNHCDLGEFFLDGKNTQKRGIRISGDGFTGTKRNSTNVKTNKVFTRNFIAKAGGDTFDAVVIDTLSPNNTFGDYSIDDSSFTDMNFLGCFGSAQRFASSEIILNNVKYSFCSDSNSATSEGVIILGSGSSIKSLNSLFTETGNNVKTTDGASVGRSSFIQGYTEQSQSVWAQTGGTVRALSYTDGYFSSLKNAPFFTMSNVELQCYMSGNAWPEDPSVNGFKDIDLGGEKGSLHWVQQTGTSSFKSYRPDIKNYGCFESPSAFIQTSQGNYKKLSHMAQNSRLDVLQVFVDTTLTADKPASLNFKDINAAMKYIDQLGVTTVEIVLASGQTHFATTQKITIAGNVVISSDGTASVAVSTGNWLVNGGHVEFKSVAVRGDDAAVILDGGGTIKFNAVTTNMGAAASAFVTVKSGNVDIINGVVSVGKFLKMADSGTSTGKLEIAGTFGVAAGKSMVLAIAPLFDAVIMSNTNPTTGLWPRGMMRKVIPSSATAGGVWMAVNVDSGIDGGTWKAVSSISV